MADYSPIYNRKIYNTDANSDLYLKTFVTTEDNTKSKSAYYTIVLEDKDKTKSLAYSVLIGKYLTCAYSLLLTGSDKDLTAAYSVNLDNNTKSKSLAFSVVMLKEPDYTSSYEVLASNTESRTSSYEVLVEDNTANKTLGYNVMTPDSYKQKTITYNVKPLYDIDKSAYYGVLLNKDKDVTSTFDLSYMYAADYSSYYSVKDTLSVSKVCSFSTLSEVKIYTIFSEIQHPVVTGDSSVFVEDTSLFEVSDYVYLIDAAGTYQLVGLTAVNDYSLEFSPVASIDITDGIVLLDEPTPITEDADITNYVFSRKTNPNLYVGVFIDEAGFIDITPEFSGYTALTDLNVTMDSTLKLFKLRINDGGKILPYSKDLDLELRLTIINDGIIDNTVYIVNLKEKLLRTMFQYNINEMKDYNNIIEYDEFISNNLTVPDYLENDLDTLNYYGYILDTIKLSDKTTVDNIYVFFKAYDFSNIVLANVEIGHTKYKALLVPSSNILNYVTQNPNTIMLFMSGDFIYLYLPSYIQITSSIYLNVYKESAS